MKAPYSQKEEYVNVLTHGLGIILSIFGGLFLILEGFSKEDPLLGVSIVVFVITMTLLYTASTLYHYVSEPLLKRRLKVLDHACIYLLIAGTYTPYTMGALRGAWGWGLFSVIWSLAIAGVVFKLFFTGRFNIIATLLYVAMGWLVVVALAPMMEALEARTLFFLFAGGISYTVGVLFYLRKSMPYSHGIWHLFVLGGSILHAISISTL